MFDSRLADAETLTLKKAVLVYEGGNSAYATIHDVTEVNGGNVIMPGRGLTMDALAELNSAVTGSAKASAEYLPENILSIGLNHLVWYCTGSDRQVWFKTNGDDGLSGRTGRAPQPNLLFAAHEGDLYVYAYKTRGRPGRDAPLWKAPYYNVWRGGKVCLGNADFPKKPSIANIEKYERAFWGSYFTHSNQHGKNQLTKHAGDIAGLWQDLLDGKFSKFPNCLLVRETEVDNVGALLEGIK